MPRPPASKSYWALHFPCFLGIPHLQPGSFWDGAGGAAPLRDHLPRVLCAHLGGLPPRPPDPYSVFGPNYLSHPRRVVTFPSQMFPFSAANTIPRNKSP